MAGLITSGPWGPKPFADLPMPRERAMKELEAPHRHVLCTVRGPFQNSDSPVLTPRCESPDEGPRALAADGSGHLYLPPQLPAGLCFCAALRCGCTVGDTGLEDLCLLPCLSPVLPGLLPGEDGQAPPEGGREHEKSQISHHDSAK
ncbi:unnamed protein product [Gulo gulo]|uniref:Uncharacterized protein n=1 Tax=Gulo gulo TaxID=48420 RepID=A0A9X9LVW9_GULGU|nr:unnamed protein product [Gulo gulo]